MAEEQEQPEAARRVTLVGVAERLLAGTAVAAAAIYVLINALYIDFYDDFGIRPEDVGWDRLTVLGRSAWIAVFGLSLIAIFGYIYNRQAMLQYRYNVRAMAQYRIKLRARTNQENEREIAQTEAELKALELNLNPPAPEFLAGWGACGAG